MLDSLYANLQSKMAEDVVKMNSQDLDTVDWKAVSFTYVEYPKGEELKMKYLLYRLSVRATNKKCHRFRSEYCSFTFQYQLHQALKNASLIPMSSAKSSYRF